MAQLVPHHTRVTGGREKLTQPDVTPSISKRTVLSLKQTTRRPVTEKSWYSGMSKGFPEKKHELHNYYCLSFPSFRFCLSCIDKYWFAHSRTFLKFIFLNLFGTIWSKKSPFPFWSKVSKAIVVNVTSTSRSFAKL